MNATQRTVDVHNNDEFEQRDDGKRDEEREPVHERDDVDAPLRDHRDPQHEHDDAHEEREELPVRTQNIRVFVDQARSYRLHLPELQEIVSYFDKSLLHVTTLLFVK